MPHVPNWDTTFLYEDNVPIIDDFSELSRAHIEFLNSSIYDGPRTLYLLFLCDRRQFNDDDELVGKTLTSGGHFLCLSTIQQDHQEKEKEVGMQVQVNTLATLCTHTSTRLRVVTQEGDIDQEECDVDPQGVPFSKKRSTAIKPMPEIKLYNGDDEKL